MAGGRGTRLWPATAVVNKQLLPIYDKPMIFYPLSVLMMADIREILVISTSDAIAAFERLLGDGSPFGISIEYAVQDSPNGVAEALLIGEEFIGAEASALILGDNIFHGNDLLQELTEISRDTLTNTVFGYYMEDPTGFGVIVLDDAGRPIKFLEKPEKSPSHWVVPGLYFYAPGVSSIARQLTPSARGELEITDVNSKLLQQGTLAVQLIGRGVAWLDGGSHEGLLDAAEFVRVIEKRTGLKICCPEEVAFRKGFIDASQLRGLAARAHGSGYADYLRRLMEREL